MEPLTPKIVRQWLTDAPTLANDRSCKVRGLINTLTWLASDWLEKHDEIETLTIERDSLSSSLGSPR